MSQYTNYGYLNSQLKAPKNKSNPFLRILLIYILPFIIINACIFFIVTLQPKYEVNIHDTKDYKTVDIDIKIKSWFPKKDFTVMLESNPVEMTKESRSTYTATIASNGTLEVSVTNLNGMNKTTFEHISEIDDAPPTISDNSITDTSVSIGLEDTQSGIDFTSIYAVCSDTSVITPCVIDEGLSTVDFSYDGGPLEVHVFDKVGNEALATFNTIDTNSSDVSDDVTVPDDSEISQ